MDTLRTFLDPLSSRLADGFGIPLPTADAIAFVATLAAISGLLAMTLRLARTSGDDDDSDGQTEMLELLSGEPLDTPDHDEPHGASDELLFGEQFDLDQDEIEAEFADEEPADAPLFPIAAQDDDPVAPDDAAARSQERKEDAWTRFFTEDPDDQPPEVEPAAEPAADSATLDEDLGRHEPAFGDLTEDDTAELAALGFGADTPTEKRGFFGRFTKRRKRTADQDGASPEPAVEPEHDTETLNADAPFAEPDRDVEHEPVEPDTPDTTLAPGFNAAVATWAREERALLDEVTSDQADQILALETDRHQLAELEQRRAHLTSARNSIADSIDDLTRERDQIAAAADADVGSSTEGDAGDLDDEFDELADALGALLDGDDTGDFDQHDELVAIDSRLAEMNNELGQAIDELDELGRNISDIQADLEARDNADIDQLDQHAGAAEAQLDRFEQRLYVVADDLQSIVDSVDEPTPDDVRHIDLPSEGEFDELVVELGDVTAHAGLDTAQAEEARAQVRVLLSELAAPVEAAQTLADTLEVADALPEIDEVELAAERARQAADLAEELATRHTQITQQHAELSAELDTLEQHVDMVRGTLDTAGQTLERHRLEADDTDETLTELAASMHDAAGRIVEAEAELRRVAGDAAAKLRAAADARREDTQLRKEAIELRTETHHTDELLEDAETAAREQQDVSDQLPSFADGTETPLSHVASHGQDVEDELTIELVGIDEDDELDGSDDDELPADRPTDIGLGGPEDGPDDELAVGFDEQNQTDHHGFDQHETDQDIEEDVTIELIDLDEGLPLDGQGDDTTPSFTHTDNSDEDEDDEEADTAALLARLAEDLYGGSDSDTVEPSAPDVADELDGPDTLDDDLFELELDDVAGPQEDHEASADDLDDPAEDPSFDDDLDLGELDEGDGTTAPDVADDTAQDDELSDDVFDIDLDEFDNFGDDFDEPADDGQTDPEPAPEPPAPDLLPEPPAPEPEPETPAVAARPLPSHFTAARVPDQLGGKKASSKRGRKRKKR